MSRREFVRRSAGLAGASLATRTILLEAPELQAVPSPVPASDTLRFGIIGTGVRGCELLQASRHVKGAECVVACDLYDSRHQAAREFLGQQVPVTREYRDVLERKDLDALLVATPDHWHRRLVEESAAAGKDVYCEKPMSHTLEDGFAMVKAIEQNRRIFQAGSQRVSSIVYAKAREIFHSGKLGQVTAIESSWDRNTPGGAWVNPIPPDASEQTIDWERFLGGAPKRAFDPKRFFRWRCFADYGEGLAGDLFVHMLSGIHFITGASTPPQRASSSGGLFRWKEDRDFPDLLLTLFEYPDFRLSMRCNQNNESGESMSFYGTEGTMTIRDTTSMPAFGVGAANLARGPMLTFTPQDTRPQPDSYTIFGWPAKLRDGYLQQWQEANPLPQPGKFAVEHQEETYLPPAGYSDVVGHLANFFHAVRTRRPVVENEVFGHHASIGCHMANYSYFRQTVARWDENTKSIRG
jgi:predicted dehydrogenase